MSDINFKKMANELNGKQGRSSSVLLLTIIALVAMLLTWSAVTELDKVTRGSGKTVSEGQNQMVQSSEAGVLRARYVREGDQVQAGAPLFDIDPVEAKGQLEQAEHRAGALRAKAVRLQAEVDGKAPVFEQALQELAPDAVGTEMALFQARLNDLDAKIAILEQRKKQRLNEIDELKIDQETATNGLALIEQEIKTVAPLVTSGLAPETRLITLKRDREVATGQANSAQSAQARISAALDEISEQLKSERQTYFTSALTDLSSITAELAELEAVLPALRDRVERTTVRSPVAGVVNRVNFTSDGAYVKTGDVLLELVPSGEDLIVEAKIDPKDIANIVVGNPVKVSLTAYDPSKYGRLDGSVTNISADALSNAETGEQYYLIDVSIDSALYEEDGTAVPVISGMVATVEVLSGKRSILTYFWQPVVKMKDSAFKD
jgi:adhesin transport system membrane fusion protein